MKKLLLILLTFASITAYGQTYTLKALLDSVESNNPGLKQFAFKAKANIERGKGAKAWDAPTISIGLDEFPYGTPMDMSARKMAMINVDQMLPVFANQRAKAKYYESFKAQTQNDYETAKNMLFGQVKAAFYSIAVTRQRIKIIDEQEKMLKLLIKIAETRLQYSKSDLPTIYNAKAKLSTLIAARIREQSMIKHGEHEINHLMNKNSLDPIQLDSTVSLRYYSDNPEKYHSNHVFENRSDVQKVANTINSMKLEQEMIKTMSRPMFGVGFKNMRMPDGTWMYSAMASVKIPFFPWSSKGYKAEGRAVGYEIQAMKKEQENMVNEAASSIQKSLIDLQSQYTEVKAYEKEIIPAYKKTFDVNLNAFAENTGDIFKTLMAWDDLMMKRMEYLDKLGIAYQMEVAYETAIQHYY